NSEGNRPVDDLREEWGRGATGDRAAWNCAVAERQVRCNNHIGRQALAKYFGALWLQIGNHNVCCVAAAGAQGLKGRPTTTNRPGYIHSQRLHGALHLQGGHRLDIRKPRQACGSRCYHIALAISAGLRGQSCGCGGSWFGRHLGFLPWSLLSMLAFARSHVASSYATLLVSSRL